MQNRSNRSNTEPNRTEPNEWELTPRSSVLCVGLRVCGPSCPETASNSAPAAPDGTVQRHSSRWR
eukprot:14637201-Alexandrium_andersonii.AAC.1